jgi:pyruvate, water dikinase
MKSSEKKQSRKDACVPLTALQGRLADKYRFFKEYLEHNNSALKIIAGLEQLYYGGNPFEFFTLRSSYGKLLEEVFGAISALEVISGRKYPALEKAVREIDGSVSEDLRPHYASATSDIVLPFEQINSEFSKAVGAKAANLAFARNELALPVPHGFAVTAYAFEIFMEENSLAERVEKELMTISAESPEDLERSSKRLQAMVLDAEVPRTIADEILKAYAYRDTEQRGR